MVSIYISSEKEYVDKKIAEYNKEDSGKEDIWAKAWSYDKESKYHPQFIESFFGNSGMKISKEAKYTLIFKTTYIDPGALKSSIDADVWIVETSGKLNKLAVLSVSGATGYKGWETSYRISQAYAQSGKKLALFIFNK